MLVSTLDAGAKAFACDHLGETEEVARESVQQIKTFLKDNPEINARNDELSILFFLRSCKFNVEQTQKRITKCVKLSTTSNRLWMALITTISLLCIARLCVPFVDYVPACRVVLSIGSFLQIMEKTADRSSVTLSASNRAINQTPAKFNFYRQRAERVEWFTYRDPFLTELSELLALGVFLPLRKKDAENRQIVIIRTAAHDPSRHKQNDVFKIGRMVLDYLVSTDESLSVYGIRAIFDMQGISLGHAMQMTPLIIKRAVDSWESYPLRIQKLEFVNANFGINVVLDIFRSFMSAKMKARVSAKRGKPEFKASDNLPVDLGGNESSYAQLAEHWKLVLESNAKWFVDDEPFKSLI